ncbi:hypothetical protein CANCADRAFT_133820 [Tortispora caseinolytica NRRL Y-17796]|uniref:PQ-loop-domain-containing protein n=1 Tax=Tortispora caseinolytica NRRL Y-17796 TaxID=767744 RepID=A0A1E4TBH9_9ASCO|nr:hypothetical protein CANCADRAFT_133820 [Tortispora caseinolytica NRRL Y-17796]
MSDASVSSNILGTIGTVFWCIQLVPQIWYNWRRKTTEGLPPLMMFLWAVSGVPFGIYFIVAEANIPVQVQPEIFMFFSAISWAQTLYYPPNARPLKQVLIVFGVFIIICAGVMVACIIPLKPVYERGTTWPNLIFGISASVLLLLGLIPPYIELAKRQGRVVGINFVFLCFDSMGAIFSLLSLVVDRTFDIMGGVLYIIVLVLELGIMTSHLVWLIRRKYYPNTLRADAFEDDKPDTQMTTELEVCEVPKDAANSNESDSSISFASPETDNKC